MNKLKKILAKILEIDEKKINDGTAPDNTPTWDSYNGLLIASELEEAYNVKFTMDEITKVKNVKDIRKVLAKHNIKTDS
jgi:acyl carrier protein